MKLAIMQPYFFPYIGYWQLINDVDIFVIYDDVNFIKQGYINRNSILNSTKPQQFTLELIGASSNKLINEISVGNNRKKLLKTIKQNYLKAPYYENIYLLIQEILENNEKNLAKFLTNSLKVISNYLDIDTQFILSSELDKDNRLKAQDKVIEITKILKVPKYINAIGGQELYDKEVFQKNEIELNFLVTKLTKYKQFKEKFVPYLSIIDILMFSSKNEIKNMLGSYELI